MTNKKIKQKEKNKNPIKIIDRKVIYTKRLKNNMITLKEKTKEYTSKNEENSPSEYSIDKISNKTNIMMRRGLNNLNRYGKKSVKETKTNIQNTTKKIKQRIENKTIKRKNTNIKEKINKTDKTIKKVENQTRRTIKNTGKTIKNTTKTGKEVYKKALQTEKAIRKSAKKTYQVAKTTAKGIKVGIKATFTAIKATIMTTKALAALLMAIGWIAVFIIFIVCIIAMFCSMFMGDETGTSNSIVTVALAEVGNTGGEKYWRWYGFEERVEWCAIFVSWCANECGYIDSEVLPRFSSCQNEGVPYFQEKGLWQGRGYFAKSGDIIFFDWDQNNTADHVGIVQKTINDTVYTIEGNSSGDSCRQQMYNINSNLILGYGIPLY